MRRPHRELTKDAIAAAAAASRAMDESPSMKRMLNMPLETMPVLTDAHQVVERSCDHTIQKKKKMKRQRKKKLQPKALTSPHRKR
jgi:hypothetical protein